jgi:hypothetical protein
MLGSFVAAVETMAKESIVWNATRRGNEKLRSGRLLQAGAAGLPRVRARRFE